PVAQLKVTVSSAIRSPLQRKIIVPVVLLLSQANQSSSTSPEETPRVIVSVSEGGWEAEPAAIASRPAKGAYRYADEAHRRIGREASGEVSPFARSDAVIEGRYVPGCSLADRFAAHLSSRHAWSDKYPIPELT